jgi:hypothetical protein
MTKQRIDEMKKFIQLAEGTWALPQSDEHYQMLANLLFGSGAKLTASGMREALYSVYGDDELYDMLDDLESTNKSAEARPYVIDWIKNNDPVAYNKLYSIGKAQTFESNRVSEGIVDNVANWFLKKGAAQVIKAIDQSSPSMVASMFMQKPKKNQKAVVQAARHYLENVEDHPGLRKFVEMLSHGEEMNEDFRSDSFNPKYQAAQNREDARRAREQATQQRVQASKSTASSQNAVIAQIMMDTFGEVFPDGDPFDFILPKLRKMGIREDDAMSYLNRAAKSVGYKDYHDALDSMHGQYYADNPELAEGKWDYPDHAKGKGDEYLANHQRKRDERKAWRKKVKAERHKALKRGELTEEGYDDASEQFFVAIRDGQDYWVGSLEKEDGKWYESTVFGNSAHGFGGKNYMGYLTRDDIMTWLHKDYRDVRGPFDNEYDAEKAMDEMSGNSDGEVYFENVSLSKIAKTVLREAGDIDFDFDELDAESSKDCEDCPEDEFDPFIESADDDFEDEDRIIDVGDDEDFEDNSLPYNWTDDESLEDEFKRGLRFD